MSRRQSDSLVVDVLNSLRNGPFWLGPVLAAVAYVGLSVGGKWSPPAKDQPFAIDTVARLTFGAAAVKGAPWIAAAILAVWAVIQLSKLSQRPNLASEYPRPHDDEKPSVTANPTCPACGSVMKLRTARKGANVGSQFWGCSRFPACRTTQPA